MILNKNEQTIKKREKKYPVGRVKTGNSANNLIKKLSASQKHLSVITGLMLCDLVFMDFDPVNPYLQIWFHCANVNGILLIKLGF